MLFRWYFFAVAEVTVKVSLSSAGDDFKISRPLGSTFFSAVLTWSVVVTPAGGVPPGERAAKNAPLYSGSMLIDPSLSALRYSSRAPMLNFRVTLTPLPSRAWAYISASSWFSGKLADPITMAGFEESPVPPPLVGLPPQALSGSSNATAATSAPSLVFVDM